LARDREGKTLGRASLNASSTSGSVGTGIPFSHFGMEPDVAEDAFLAEARRFEG
jgi:hypothetical protein